jgi:hypothetical protein
MWVAHLLAFIWPSPFSLPCDGFGHQFLLDIFSPVINLWNVQVQVQVNNGFFQHVCNT